MAGAILKKQIRNQTFYGISLLSVIPVRALPDDSAEIVTQVLFGETFELLDKRGKNWICISCSWDKYVGWIDEKMMTYIDQSTYESCSTPHAQTTEICHNIVNQDEVKIPILMGSRLPHFDGMTAKIAGIKHLYNGQAVQGSSVDKKADFVEKFALKYLHAPYLWGGRGPFGIDCSGLVQVVYSMVGIQLPRDAKDQIHEGEEVAFIDTAAKGDLAFFENDLGKIIHVGIILSDKRIIHASGQVRIDHIDHYGIYQVNRRKYSHKLRMIKRVL